jgi:hypothetical protein
MEGEKGRRRKGMEKEKEKGKEDSMEKRGISIFGLFIDH